MYKKSTEIKVGLFVLVALLALAYLTVKLAEESLVPRGTYPVYAVFENVSGLVRGARVEMAGVEIGKVGNISLLPEGRAKVELLIYKDFKISRDAEALIRTAGVLGDRFVEVKQGKTSEFLRAGATLARTKSPMDFNQLIAEVGPALKDLRKITEGLSEILGSEEGRNNLKELVANLKDASASFKEVGEKVARGEGTLGKLLVDEALYNDMRRSFEDFKVTMGNLKEVSEKMRRGEGTLGKLLTDETLYTDIKVTMGNLKEISEKMYRGEGTLGKLLTDEELYLSFKEAMQSVEKGSKAIAEVANKINRGEGTLGKLLTDEELYENLKDTAASLNRIVKKVERGEGTLGKLINDDSLYLEAKRTLQNVNRASTGIQEQVPISILGTIAGAAMQ